MADPVAKLEKFRAALDKFGITARLTQDLTDTYDDATGEVTAGTVTTTVVRIIPPLPVTNRHSAPDTVQVGDMQTLFIPEEGQFHEVEIGASLLIRRARLVQASTARQLTFNANAPPGTPATIVASSGSFVTDGFKHGMRVAVDGSVSNDGTYLIDTVSALTLTLVPDETLVDEGPLSSGATLEAGKSYQVVEVNRFDVGEDDQGNPVTGAWELFVRR